MHSAIVMTLSHIPVSALAPSFTLPAIDKLTPGSRALLLAQERLQDAFQLASRIRDQHLFIADYPGVAREPLFKALCDTQGWQPRNLVALKQEGEPELQWREPSGDNVGSLAKQESAYAYVNGPLRRADLIGKMTTIGGKRQYQPGLLAKHNWLFLSADSLCRRESLWDFLLQVLSQGFYRVSDELPKVPLHTTLVLVGHAGIYSELKTHEPQFNECFPLLGEVNNEMDLTRHHELEYGSWLVALAQEAGVTLDESALLPLFLHGSRLSEHQQRLALAGQDMVQLFAQAAAYRGTSHLDGKAITKALQQAEHRHNISERFSAQSFDDSFINLLTDGEKVGQINGLTVIDSIDYSYGEPARITATVHYGDGEVADIERKSELGGNIHAKGMMILSACLYRIFGRDAPLHLNANIVFEQSYQEIDGDSASLAEYCALMSAIAEQPIRQSLAVTGALDQFGNVQAIGGVNEKIEGFFSLCERRGLTGEQGVIIPKANLLQLNLDPKVIEAVKAGRFQLYQVAHMDEAVELLMDLPAGVADEDDNFPEGTLYGMVQQRLDKLAGHDDEEPLGFFARLLAKWTSRGN
ncbi:AAA family ATPase [Shewanella cyperi]|nr:S16 family serine protease [Shewanella cyperi]QSX39333.1 AAA family ATPase [Shewanella cyperi]